VSIYGIGVDIVEIERVKKSLDKLGDAFAKKILHRDEFEKFSTMKLKERYLAKRFAAKEAFAKALGTGIVNGITLPKIEIINDSMGKPEICLHGTTRLRYESLGITNCFLSISDEHQYAVAQVILENK